MTDHDAPPHDARRPHDARFPPMTPARGVTTIRGLDIASLVWRTMKWRAKRAKAYIVVTPLAGVMGAAGTMVTTGIMVTTGVMGAVSVYIKAWHMIY